MSQSSSKIIYVGDPMCSWCYGIAPELIELIDEFKDDLDLELVMGGLRPYNTEKMTDLKDFLTHHWEEVNARSGQEFNYSILDKSEIPYDTEPPSRATLVVRKLDSNKELTFFKACQSAFYVENLDMNKSESYHGILSKLELDVEKFEELFHSQEMKDAVKQDFAKAEKMGVRGFPTILLEHNGEVQLIANGYSTKEKMSKRIHSVINK